VRQKKSAFFRHGGLDVPVMPALDQLRDIGDGSFLHDASNGTPVCGDVKRSRGEQQKKHNPPGNGLPDPGICISKIR
jgi:hypothetical protein